MTDETREHCGPRPEASGDAGLAAVRGLVLRSVLFCLVLVVMLLVLQTVMHDSGGGQTWWNTYLSQPEDSLDVLFLGSSFAHGAISPLDLWRDYGFTSFNLTGSNQSLGTSYHFLREAFETQHPKVVVLELHTIVGQQMNDQALWSNYGMMPWGENKVRGYVAAAPSLYSFQYLVFPLLRDHTKWHTLDAADLGKLVAEPPPPPGLGHPVIFITEDESTRTPDPVISPATMDEGIDSLRRIARLCADNDADLVLYFTPGSLDEQAEVLDEIRAGPKGADGNVEYLDLNDARTAMGIDPSSDYALADGHLNYHGALKVTRYLGRHLVGRYGLVDRRGMPEYVEWDVLLREYDDYVDELEGTKGNAE